jgi:hypothetical protein
MAQTNTQPPLNLGEETAPQDFDLSSIGVEEKTLHYSKGGKSTRYMLMRGLGSHWVSGLDLSDAKTGYNSLPQGIRDAYKPHEVFWLAVAAARNPELLPNNEAPLNVPPAVEETLEERLKGTEEASQEPAVRDKRDIVEVTVVRALSQLDNFYATVVNGVQEYLARTKKNRDLKGALSLAVLGETVAPIVNRYEGLLGNIGAQMPYKAF